MSNSLPVLRRRRRFAVLLAVVAGTLLGAGMAWGMYRVRDLERRLAALEKRCGVFERLVLLEGQAPDGAALPLADYEVRVISKQWMWKFQHPNGISEIGELHLPVNGTVELTATSEDVIHRFDIPGQGLALNAVPGRHTKARIVPRISGRYAFACGQFCGVHHGQHVGTLVAMEPADFDRWTLASGGKPGVPRRFLEEGLVDQNERVPPRGPKDELRVIPAEKP